MTKLEALKYLFENDKYRDEWTGAGMWEAVQIVITYKKKISKKLLNSLLEQAEHF